ncbi:MAG TPA: hypothetical protein VG870_09055, partial [Chitinophagaceae bacterium]|nr:hypothetical protein [Chitinophagaceae bacterium]
MDKDLHHIDDLFREALEGHQEPPSPQVWEGLESDLDRKDALTYRKKFRAARRVAAILLLLLASFLLYELANRSGKNREREEVQQTSPPAQGSLQKTHPTAGQNQAASADARSMAPAGDASLTIPANSGKMRQGSRTAARPEATGTGPDSFAGNHTGQLPASARRQVSDAASTPSVRPSHSPVQGTGREIETQLPGSPAKQRNTVNALALAKQSTSLSPFFRPAPTSRDASVLNPQGPAGQPIYTQDQQPVSQLTFPGASGLDRLMVSPPHPFARFSPDASGFLAVIRGKNLLASRWSLSLVGASEWYGNRLLDDEPDFNGSGRPHDDRREIESRERKQPAMGLGLLADYRLSGRLALQTGLVYSQSVTQAGPQQIYAQPDGTGKV